MAKKVLINSEDLEVKAERLYFNHMLAKNPNYFGNIIGSELKPIIKLISDTTYEQLTCVGYNPETTEMKATFSIKRSSGYSGNLCHLGSFEYVRFYLDFHDGAGFIDQGSVAVNVHDIPNQKDCNGISIFPIQYVASLKKKTRRLSRCSSPLLPTLRAILSWSVEPPPASPNWPPVWGNRLDCDVQLKPSRIFIPTDFEIDLSQYFEIAQTFPNLTAKQIEEVSGVNIGNILPVATSVSLKDLVQKYTKLEVPVKRTVFKEVYNMIKYPTSEIALIDKSILDNLKISIDPIIDEIIALPFDTSKANVDYEELECVGLDYATESLVATLKIKKDTGFVGDLCDSGSIEYIAFWVDWNDKCSWEYVDTVELKVHDIAIKGDYLCYSVSSPLNATYHRKLCNNPNVIRVRGVLSWNAPPSTTNPNILEYYGNRVDSHVQIRPGIILNPGEVIPYFDNIGGIDVNYVNNFTGRTINGAHFRYGGGIVPVGSTFGGLVVLTGPSFDGYRYKIKIRNLADNTETYASNSFWVDGVWGQNLQEPDAQGYYHFLNYYYNTGNILARLTPGTDDQFSISMEVDTIPGVFSKTIQMDNTAPLLQLHIDNQGDCTKYKKGDTIEGSFSVYDQNIRSWSFESTWGSGILDPLSSTTNNTPGFISFDILTPIDAYPCGRVSLSADDKTIQDSVIMRPKITTEYIICLKEK